MRMMSFGMTLGVIIALLTCSMAQGFEAHLIAECTGSTVYVAVDVLDATPPGGNAFAGYVVVRDVLGRCEDSVVLTDTTIPFDEDVTLNDGPSFPGHANRYAVRAMTEDGELWGMSFGMWSHDVVSCESAPVYRGTIVPGMFGWGVGVEPCTEACWLPEWYWPIQIGVYSAPDWLLEYMGTGVVFDLYGEIGEYVEGPFVAIEDAVETNCDAVGTEARSWSDIKVRYGGRR